MVERSMSMRDPLTSTRAVKVKCKVKCKHRGEITIIMVKGRDAVICNMIPSIRVEEWGIKTVTTISEIMVTLNSSSSSHLYRTLHPMETQRGATFTIKVDVLNLIHQHRVLEGVEEE